MSIQRYGWGLPFCDEPAQIEPSDDGEYVYFEDHEKEVAELEGDIQVYKLSIKAGENAVKYLEQKLAVAVETLKLLEHFGDECDVSNICTDALKKLRGEA